MWALFDFPSRALLPHHRRYAVLCSETIPSRESSQFDAHPCDGAYPVVGEIHRLPAPPPRQPQTTESRAASENAGPGERSHLPEEVALQRDLAAFPQRQIRRQRMEPFRRPRSRSLPYCSFCDDLRSLYSCCPTYNHAAQRIPPVGENQNHMRHNEEDIDPHEPEMPDTRCVIPSNDRSQPMELHGLVNRSARSDRKARGDWNR